MDYYIGIDLGGSSAKTILAQRDGSGVEKQTIPFNPEARMEWAEKIRSFVDEASARKGRPAGIGVSAPGMASLDGKSIARMPGRLHGLEGLNWAEFLEAQLVPVLNDAHAALLGEA